MSARKPPPAPPRPAGPCSLSAAPPPPPPSPQPLKRRGGTRQAGPSLPPSSPCQRRAATRLRAASRGSTSCAGTGSPYPRHCRRDRGKPRSSKRGATRIPSTHPPSPGGGPVGREEKAREIANGSRPPNGSGGDEARRGRSPSGQPRPLREL